MSTRLQQEWNLVPNLSTSTTKPSNSKYGTPQARKHFVPQSSHSIKTQQPSCQFTTSPSTPSLILIAIKLLRIYSIGTIRHRIIVGLIAFSVSSEPRKISRTSKYVVNLDEKFQLNRLNNLPNRKIWPSRFKFRPKSTKIYRSSSKKPLNT